MDVFQVAFCNAQAQKNLIKMSLVISLTTLTWRIKQIRQTRLTDDKLGMTD